ncbi:MAG: C-GCAxxG-C-C family protein, partial [Oscillibacter sp.]
MNRCERGYAYHKEGYNCAQSVLGAFGDLIGEEKSTMAVAGGFGGGIGGSHAELCGAVSGGVMVLSLLFPHTEGSDTAGKRQIYATAKEFRRRFEAIFGLTRCGELLAARPQVSEKTPAAQAMGLTTHCDVMIVTAVEIVEGMLKESGVA